MRKHIPSITFTFTTERQRDLLLNYITLGYFMDDYYASLSKSYRDSVELVDAVMFTNCYPVNQSWDGDNVIIPWRKEDE